MTNQAGGTLSAVLSGIAASGAPASVSNAGLIEAAAEIPNGIIFEGPIPVADGISFAAGGIITNLAGGTITGTNNGVYGGGELTVVNAGTIALSSPYNNSDGVDLQQGGTVTNLAGGTIIGQASGVQTNFGSATITNTGTILALGTIFAEAVHLSSGGSVTNAAGGVIAALNGTVGYGVFMAGGTLVNAGTISGSADAVSFFAGTANLLVVDPGAVFVGTVDGGGTLGTLALAAGNGTIAGLGTQFINFGSIAFDPGANWFVAGNTAGLAGTISGFALGDTIDVTGITVTGSSYANGILTLDEASGSTTLDLPGNFATNEFFVTNVSGGADVSVECFRAGTRILTPRGQVAVEDLRVGDQVETVLGGAPVPVTWIGHRTIDCTRHPRPAQVWPVRVSAGAGAFGPSLPGRDLFLSPDHAVYIDEVLIPVKHLINQDSIVQMPMDQVTYYHVELPQHDVLRAEGLPTESYLDIGDRSNFANSNEPMRLFPDFSTRSCDVAGFWEVHGCAPLTVTGQKLSAVRSQVRAWAAVRIPQGAASNIRANNMRTNQ